MTTALLIVDIQNDYFPGGKMELENSIQAAKMASKILAYFRQSQLPRVHVQHIASYSGAPFFVAGTNGVEINEKVKPVGDELIIQKHFPNSFRETQLLDHLKKENVDNLVIAGMMTNICVDATVRAAFDNGFKTTVLSDACANRSLSFQGIQISAQHVHAAFMASFTPIYAKILTVDEYLSSAK